MALKRTSRLLVMLLALVMVAAACANDPAEETTDDTAAVEATEDAGEATDAEATEAADDMATEDMSDDMAEDAPSEEMTEDMADDMGAAQAATTEELCAQYEGVEIPEGFNVGLVTDIGKVNDGTFNQFAYDGMIAASECLGFETTFIETASEADYGTNLSTILEAEPEVVITVGFLLADATLEVAEANPEVDFIGIDQFQPEYPENYVGILFREDQGGFLAGAMAGLLTESGTVGVVGGLETVPPVVRFVNGYEAGATYVDESVNVLSIYTDSFTDPAQGASAAEQFLGEGADVIFGAGGQTGSGAVTAATAAGAWGIGVDQDEYFTTFEGGSAPGSEFLATSALKRVDLGVFTQIGEILSGAFGGGIYELTAENGGITYAPFHDAAIPDDVASQIEEIRAGLADGSIETGIDPVTGLPQE